MSITLTKPDLFLLSLWVDQGVSPGSRSAQTQKGYLDMFERIAVQLPEELTRRPSKIHRGKDVTFRSLETGIRTLTALYEGKSVRANPVALSSWTTSVNEALFYAETEPDAPDNAGLVLSTPTPQRDFVVLLSKTVQLLINDAAKEHNSSYRLRWANTHEVICRGPVLAQYSLRNVSHLTYMDEVLAPTKANVRSLIDALQHYL